MNRRHRSSPQEPPHPSFWSLVICVPCSRLATSGAFRPPPLSRQEVAPNSPSRAILSIPVSSCVSRSKAIDRFPPTFCQLIHHCSCLLSNTRPAISRQALPRIVTRRCGLQTSIERVRPHNWLNQGWSDVVFLAAPATAVSHLPPLSLSRAPPPQPHPNHHLHRSEIDGGSMLSRVIFLLYTIHPMPSSSGGYITRSSSPFAPFAPVPPSPTHISELLSYHVSGLTFQRLSSKVLHRAAICVPLSTLLHPFQ